MVNINPREVACDALIEITEEKAYNNIALRRILRQNGALSSKDKGFVTEIVNGTIRNLFLIDYIINENAKINTEKMKPWILSVLRTAVYQLKFMDKVPDSAACDEAVKLTKKRGLEKLSGFVNGVLRSVSRNGITFPDKNEEPVKYLKIKYSFPEWILKMWLHEYSFEFVEDLCQKSNLSPDITICCNKLKTNAKEVYENLIKLGADIKLGIYNEEALHISKVSDLSSLEIFKKGYFHVQDESSMLAVKILNPKKGEKILDVCAAPGGKSLFSAELMGNSGEIISRDIHTHKLDLLNNMAQTLGISIISVEEKDAAVIYENDKKKYDKVLLDVPCSGLGIIRKKPDIKYNKTGNDIDELIKLQRKILTSCADYVVDNGIIVYCTCTICKKENIKNVEWFLKEFDFELCDISNFLPESFNEESVKNGYLQMYPNINGTDGFFVARMKKKRRM